MGAGVCLLLAILTLLGAFGVHALFPDFLCGLFKGLIGYGFWMLPVMLLVSAWVLALHRGRPVRLRVWCALLLPVAMGAFFHLVLAKGVYVREFALVKQLWTEGRALQSGGVCSGLLALGLSAAISKVGAGLIFVLALVGTDRKSVV